MVVSPVLNIGYVCFVYAPKEHGPQGSWWVCTIKMTKTQKLPSVALPLVS